MTASEAPLAGVRVDRRVMRLAALFVQPDGCYAGLQDVDAWPEADRDRYYAMVTRNRGDAAARALVADVRREWATNVR